MAAVEESPLLKALPPETDYLTYLTIVEYNLSRDQLPILHDLLQDSTLTINIGWDLVKLLLPLLPESEQCLRDIALLGNPRETILKVAELLEELGQENEEEDQLDGESSDHDAVRPARNSHINENESRTSLLTLQFQSLLHMLCILHPRIKTRYPSRFLVTSIQAVIRAYKALAQVPGSMGPILMLLKSMSESKQPHLPPRKSQQAVPTVTVGAAAPDPEQEADTVTEEEAGLKQRILRCFVTHVMESYICALLPVTETSPLAWSNRFFERRYPEKLLPHRSTYRSLFQEQADLEMRDATISQLLVSLYAIIWLLRLNTCRTQPTATSPCHGQTSFNQPSTHPPYRIPLVLSSACKICPCPKLALSTCWRREHSQPSPTTARSPSV